MNIYENLKKEKEINKSKYRENVPSVDGSLFTGQVNKEGIPQGVGMISYSNLNVEIVGEFVSGKLKNDMGMMINEYGEYIFGRIKNGIFNSPIYMITKDTKNSRTIFFFGETKNNNKDGKGKDLIIDDDYYEQNYLYENLKGKGNHLDLNNEYYDGDFKNGVYEGKGKYYFPKGAYYEGDWKNGSKEGEGKYVHSIGNYYEEAYKNDEREGFGKEYLLLEGQIQNIYEGNWLNGEREGKFMVTIKHMEPYEVEYKKGKMI